MRAHLEQNNSQEPNIFAAESNARALAHGHADCSQLAVVSHLNRNVFGFFLPQRTPM